MNLFDKKITLTYDEERYEHPGNPSVMERTVTMYADNEQIFQGVDYLYEDGEERSIIDSLSDMALAALKGEYEYHRVWFNDDDEGQDVGFIKAGRVLQLSEGVLHNVAHYIHPNQMINAIVELLELRAAKKESSGKLVEIKRVLYEQRRSLVEDDPQFSLNLQFVNDYFRVADRLRVQWADDFFYTDTAFTNIAEELLDAAILLLEKNSSDIVIEIADYNDDNPLAREEKSKYYRSFFMDIRPFKQNTSVLISRSKKIPGQRRGSLFLLTNLFQQSIRCLWIF